MCNEKWKHTKKNALAAAFDLTWAFRIIQNDYIIESRQKNNFTTQQLNEIPLCDFLLFCWQFDDSESCCSTNRNIGKYVRILTE